MLAETTSNIALGVTAVSVLGVLVAYVLSIRRPEPDAVQAVLLLGTITLALVYDRVNDGHTAYVLLVPGVLLIVGRFLVPIVKRTPAPGQDDDAPDG